jgi:sugar phosphate isomerase/epimerase
VSESALRPSINQSCFPAVDTREFAACVSAAGFRSVELRTLGRTEPLTLIQTAVQQYDLRVEAINGLMDWALPDDPDPRPALEQALRVATAVGAPLIVCAGPIRQGMLPPTDVVMTSAVERLTLMAAAVRSTGVRLALEQIGKSSTRPGAASGIRRLDDALDVAGRASDDVVVTLDSHNLATADERFDLLARVPVSKIGIAQVAGTSPTGSGRALPGDGETDNNLFVGMLAAMGYTGAVSIEMFPAKPWEDPSGFASLAFARIRALIDTATSRV